MRSEGGNLFIFYPFNMYGQKTKSNRGVSLWDVLTYGKRGSYAGILQRLARKKPESMYI